MKAEKPINELVAITLEIGEEKVSQILSCHLGFVHSWLPKQMPNGRIETGWEPSVDLLQRLLPFFVILKISLHEFSFLPLSS